MFLLIIAAQRASSKHVIERSPRGREFHNDGVAMANARSPSVALDFTDDIARS